MIRVTDIDGHVYGALTFGEVVRLMKLDSFVVDPNRRTYKKNVATRTKSWNGKTIRYHDAETFIRELVRIGVLTLKENGKKPKPERRP